MHIDIFNNDAFSVSSLTNAIQDVPFMSTKLGDLGLFDEEGIMSQFFEIEAKGTTLSLVASRPRGDIGPAVSGDKAVMRAFKTVHLPQRSTLTADQIGGVRAFGTENEVKTMQGVVNERLTKLRRNIDLTLEYQRMGAIKGTVLDADGSTVLLDVFGAFNVPQTTTSLELDVGTTKVRSKVVDLKRQIEGKLGALPYSSILVLCSGTFFDDLVDHDSVQNAVQWWNQNSNLRDDLRDGFTIAGVTFAEYRAGAVGAAIEDGEAYAIPLGVPDLFLTKFAPADYMETVNTMGLPYYAKQEPLPFNKGVEIEAQSNPICLCTRPATCVKVSAAS